MTNDDQKKRTQKQLKKRRVRRRRRNLRSRVKVLRFPIPLSARALDWHLSDAIRQTTGLQGKQSEIKFQKASSGEEKLKILKEAGYQLVEQHQ